jgi:hypothetical protein
LLAAAEQRLLERGRLAREILEGGPRGRASSEAAVEARLLLRAVVWPSEPDPDYPLIRAVVPLWRRRLWGDGKHLGRGRSAA